MLFFLLLVYISHFLESETATLITEIIDSNEQTWLLFNKKNLSSFNQVDFYLLSIFINFSYIFVNCCCYQRAYERLYVLFCAKFCILSTFRFLYAVGFFYALMHANLGGV
uniref:Transmembrane protein n=1 Tax=Heterorhabditis bacteriophora TaxID=37862 RepID=A0A1I7WHB2_HETBA